MSDTESFESVAKSYDNCTWIGRDGVKRAIDRLKAAHDREIAQAQRSTDTKHKEVATRLYSLRFHGGRFGPELSHALGGCEANEDTDTITGSYSRVLDNLARLREAHDRDMRDARECMDKLGYHRGYCDGQHSMDAEHRAIAMRLRQLPRGCTGFSDAHVSWFADLAWAMGIKEPTFAVLRDELVRLMGGVSDDTCGSQCRGACAADCGRDSGEQVEVSGDGADGDTLDPDARGHAVGRDFHELGVSDGRVADDCGAAVRCGDGGGDLHLAGVTYDVLWNERQKAVCELRKLDGCSPMAHNFRDALAASVDVPKDGAPYDDKELCHLICDRLIHLLGGDQPSGIDVLRAMDAVETSPNADGTSPNDDQILSITNELRRCALTEVPYHYGHQLQGIADRIDEQFDRICQQQEAVLQETIAEMVEECDHWKQVADINAKMLLKISGENASLKADCERLKRQRDGFKREHQEAVNRLMMLRHERDNLLDLLRDGRDEYVSAQALCDELRYQREELMRKWMHERAERKEPQGRLECTCREIESTQHERDGLQAKLGEYDSTHVELPRDVNGEVFRVGCTVKMVERHPEVLLTVHSMTLNDEGRWLLYACNDKDEYACNLSTSEFEVCEPKSDTAESIVRDLSMGAITESEAIERIGALNG